MDADEVGEDFGIGGGLEGMAVGKKLVFDDIIILDHAIVNEGDSAALVGVGVGIFVGRRSMGSPAGMSDPERAFEGVGMEEPGEAVIDFAFPFAELECVIGQDTDAGAVITPILEAAEALEDEGTGRLTTDVTYNSAHSDRMGFPWGWSGQELAFTSAALCVWILRMASTIWSRSARSARSIF